MSLARALWRAWREYTRRASGYQTDILLSLTYLLVLGPSAIMGRLLGSRLMDLDDKPRPSYWVERPPAERSLSSLERQF